MSLFDGIIGKQKKPEAVERPGQKEMADTTRQGNELVINELKKISYKDKTGTIPEERLNNYRTIIELLTDNMENAPVIVTNTKVMDDAIIYLASCVNTSIVNGHPDTVKELMEYLRVGIREMRNKIDSLDEFKRAQMQSRLEKYASVARGMIACDEIEDQIQEKNKIIFKNKEVYKEARKKFEEHLNSYLEKNPNGLEELENAAGQKGPLDGEVISLNTEKKQLVSLYSKIKEYKQLKAFNEVTLQTQREALDTLRLQIETTSNLLGQDFMDQMSRYQEEFEEALHTIRKNNEALDELTVGFDSMLDVFFSDDYFKNMVAGINVEFDKILAEEKREAEGRRIAQEQKLEEEQMNKVEPTMLINS